ncbi:hypothetical protein F53441_12611 [Fusarium austroafricanum]|uniref:T6SS Phospholipase effector Tle1-like catalytic domain-containing protein n=1 Tax=Fusarium austroafricanum TaxID=2364996 RepID=A0A8H4JX12_9HYPO|nr:hypothetical protein F53441_12611 [Fusarium austroafricanum]
MRAESNNHPGVIEDATRTDEYKKLILCFDGTGNTFSGHNGDTNVVKILRKLDRNHHNQFHYYQTGIGTYDTNGSSVNKSTIGEVKSKVSKVMDRGFGTTFDAHVMAGYRFLMRYYEDDAKIYIFGFSRGACTAKYLARLVNKVGLLCKGNEEMVPFAYRLYLDTLKHESADRVAAQKAENKTADNSSSTGTNGKKGQDIWEVWFPGNHGDIGGEDANELLVDVERDYALQMSDMALGWMIREVDRGWMNKERVQTNVVKGFMHDCLSWGRGPTFFMVLMWNIMGLFFLVPRWELNDDKDESKVGWEPYKFWPNNSSYRDTPRGAILHQSLIGRLEGMEDYRPQNNHGTVNGKQGAACLQVENGKVRGMEPYKFQKDIGRPYKEDPWD